MKKVAQRMTGFFMAIILLVALCVPVSATSDGEAEQLRIDFAATMQIVSFSGGGVGSSFGLEGHTFLIFKNIGTTEITVGHMPLEAGESVTIGTFGNRPAHKGIWYNIEGYCGVTPPTYALLTGVTYGELIDINRAINNHDTWSITDNCSSFAVDVWNAGNSGKTLSGGNPAAVVSSIKKQSGYTTNPTVPVKSVSEIARHTSTGYVYDSSGRYAS